MTTPFAPIHTKANDEAVERVEHAHHACDRATDLLDEIDALLSDETR